MRATASLPPVAATRASPASRPWVRLLPLLLAQAYLGATVMAFAFGPWEWQIDDPVTFYGFLFLAHVAIAVGYLSAAFQPPRADKGALSPRRLLLIGLVVNLLLIGPTLVLRSGGMSLMEAIQNPGAAYFASADTAGESRTALEVVRMFLGPASVLLLPIAVFYWEQFSRPLKVLSAAAIALNLVFWLMTGTNRGLADFITLVPCLLGARIAAGKLAMTARRLIIAASIFAALSLGFVAFFSLSQTSRTGNFEVPDYFPPAGVYASNAGPVMRNVSPATQGAFRGLSMYATQGYYGLALALRKPFVWTYGIGHSNFLANAFKALTGSAAPIENGYPGRIDTEDGWIRLVFWNTIYPWFASDVGFAGSLIVIGLLSRLFALSWVDTIGGANPLALPLLMMSITTFFYVPANNMVLGNPETWSAFWVLLVLWWWRRRRDPAAPLAEGAPAAPQVGRRGERGAPR